MQLRELVRVLAGQQGERAAAQAVAGAVAGGAGLAGVGGGAARAGAVGAGGGLLGGGAGLRAWRVSGGEDILPAYRPRLGKVKDLSWRARCRCAVSAVAELLLRARAGLRIALFRGRCRR